MSMIENQLKEIQDMASVLHKEKRYAAEEIMRQAANTIETLSEKLVTTNMKLESLYESVEDYGSRWIAYDDRLPEKTERYYIVWVKSEISDLEYARPALYDKDGFCTRLDEKTIAWQPLPKSYQLKRS